MARRVRWLSDLCLILVVAGCATGTPSGAPSVASPPAVVSPSMPQTTARPSTRPSGSLTVEAARSADLAYLEDQLVAIHPNPFLDAGKTAFDARVAAIDRRAASLSDV